MASAPRKPATPAKRTATKRTATKAATNRTTAQRDAGPVAKKASTPTQAARTSRTRKPPTAANVAAAQELLASIERRESNLRAAIKHHTEQLKQSKQTLKRHRSTMKSLKKDLDRIRTARVAVIDDL